MIRIPIYFCERGYVINIWDINKSMGVGMNGNDCLTPTQKCIVPHLGEQWFNQYLMTNIIEMKGVTNKF